MRRIIVTVLVALAAISDVADTATAAREYPLAPIEEFKVQGVKVTGWVPCGRYFYRPQQVLSGDEPQVAFRPKGHKEPTVMDRDRFVPLVDESRAVPTMALVPNRRGPLFLWFMRLNDEDEKTARECLRVPALQNTD